jgi:hypothetical protein
MFCEQTCDDAKSADDIAILSPATVYVCHSGESIEEMGGREGGEGGGVNSYLQIETWFMGPVSTYKVNETKINFDLSRNRTSRSFDLLVPASANSASILSKHCCVCSATFDDASVAIVGTCC